MRVFETKHAVAAIATAMLCVAAQACGSRETPSSPARRGPGIGPASDPAQLQNQPAQRIEQGARPDPSSMPANPSAVVPAENAAPEAKPPRNFSAELVQMLGNPAGCLNATAAAASPAYLDISLSTSVMPSGSVANSEVRAPGLDSGEMQCLRGRLEAVHFAAPIENAPFHVQGTLQLTRAAGAATTAQASATAKKAAAEAADTPSNDTSPEAAAAATEAAAAAAAATAAAAAQRENAP
jgi:hypothetical protein